MHGKRIDIFKRKRKAANSLIFEFSHIVNIMYFCHKLDICGVTGTGKTTTILTILEKFKINYKIINCIINSEA